MSLHKYLYCHANPVNGIDPSGYEFNAIGTVSVMGKGIYISTRIGIAAYGVYDRARWLRDGLAIGGNLLATGTVSPGMAAIWLSEFIPYSKFAKSIGKTAGNLPGVGKHLQDAFSYVQNGVKSLTNQGKDRLGYLASLAVARAKGMRPTGYKPRGNGGFDEVMIDKDGYYVIIESKAGLNPRLNPSSDTNPAQMSHDWIEKNLNNLGSENSHLKGELRRAYAEKRVRGMVVTTKIDVDGNVGDPDFLIKEFHEIGTKQW